MNSRIGSMRRFGVLWVAAALAAVALERTAFGDASVAAAERATQTQSGGGVEVTVTPLALAPDAAAWEFQVVFDTHTVTLAGDPAQFSTLVDSKGRAHRALSWQGDPPGSHHRKGVLRFQPLPGEVEVELRIDGVAGVATRRFRWRL